MKLTKRLAVILSLSCIALQACSLSAAEPSYKGLAPSNEDYASTYKIPDSKAVVINHATILTGTGKLLKDASLLLQHGKIIALGNHVKTPKNATVIDGTGKWVTPGIVDPHTHIGNFSSPRVPATMDLNEKTSINTANVWVEHAVWPQDPDFERAREGGVTTMMVLPGSANLFGGRTVTVKNVVATSAQDMKFPDAPYGLKMACGENALKVYGGKGKAPMTRMGMLAQFRQEWMKAVAYKKSWDSYYASKANGHPIAEPKRDLTLETMMGVLNGEIKTHLHCYRADEISEMIDLSKEFGFHIDVLHHAVEAYKITAKLKRENIAVATWANRWGFKLEMYDGIEENAGMLEKAGVLTSLHTDAAELSQRMNVEMAIALSAAERAGIHITKQDAIKWITSNPAKQIGIYDKTGSLEVNKMADVVIWSGDPFSIYSLAEKVFIDGDIVFDRLKPATYPASDFELGNVIKGE